MRDKFWLKILIGILGLLVLGYLAVTVYYAGDRFLPGTFVNGVYCTGYDANEASKLFTDNRKITGTLKITDNRENTEEFDISECSPGYDYRYQLTDIMHKKNPFMWIVAVAVPKYYLVEPGIDFDHEKLINLMKESTTFGDGLKYKGDCAVVMDDDGEYRLHNGLEHVPDTDKVMLEIEECLMKREFDIILSDDCFHDEELSELAEKNLAIWEKLDSFLDCKLTYDLGDRVVSMDRKKMSSFVEARNGKVATDSYGNILVDETACEEFVTDLYEGYNTYGNDVSFRATRGDVVVIHGGTYGTTIDIDAEIDFLKEALHDPQYFSKGCEPHIPEYLRKGYVRGKDDIGNTYIEVDLSAQKLYFYQEGYLVLESDVVTGDISKKRGTPQGVYYVYSKEKNRTLRGPDYESFVYYWMPVVGGVGIHDATWRSRFGGSIYKTGGSHGCINMPKSKVASLYKMVEVGTPTLVFY
ncbi:MAG: L,D-transpeptidase/peptidoglycan binding protein [Lachnospiraceae bacterium]|nr:L,D-transpeptidase/peptidoglycan binding protein [Lachnospiraceae bacterium]